MSMDFLANMETVSDASVVRVQGEIDVYSSTQLTKTLQDAMKTGTQKVVLNLQDVRYIDSTGLGVIAHCAQALPKPDGKMNVVCSNPQIRRVFDMSGLTQKNITLFQEESEALSTAA